MTPERWQQIDQLFKAALACGPAQRKQFLADKCADDEPLRLEVESLLSSLDEAEGFIDAPAGDLAAELLGTQRSRYEPGQQNQNYRIVRQLGSGGMGEVYLAEDVRLNRKVALKILPPHFTVNPDRVRRFEREARAASALNHPNIVTIYEIGQSNTTQFIATEFVDGETLREHIRSQRITIDEVLNIGSQVCSALQAAHQAGIVHRDIKPENIMLRRDGIVKVLDFGLAKLTPDELAVDSQAPTNPMVHTNPGVVMGTVGYMSPEQARAADVDARTDIWSLGVVMYEMVSGRPPFVGETPSHVIVSILEHEPVPLSINSEVPGELQRIVNKCLVKNRERRYQKVGDLVADLKRLKQRLEIDAAIGGTAEPGRIDDDAVTRIHKPVATDDETQLNESTPAVLQLSRFSKASVALAALALIAAIALWPLHQHSEIGSELKLDYSKEAAMSKAREVVTGLGYSTNNLEWAGRFIGTGFDLKYLSNKEGRSAARQAVREGKTGVWQFMFAQTSADAAGGVFTTNPGPGQLLVTISPQGQLMSFSTAPEESSDISAVDQNQAVTVATEQARRWLSFEPAGYNIEVVPRSAPPGLTEVTWRNSTPVLGHKEIVRANIQGTKVTRLSRQFDAPQSVKEASAFADAVSNARAVVLVLAVVGLYVFGVSFVIYSKRWKAFGRKISIAAALLIGLGFFSMIYFRSLGSGSSLVLFLVSLVYTLVISVAFFPSGAGFLEWLRVYNPARLFALEQIIERRFFSPSVSSALVHGVLGGALLAGLFEAGTFIANRILGAAPSFSGEIEMINSGWPIITGITFSFTIGLIVAGGLILLVEFSERVVGHGVLASIVPALLIAFAMTSDFEQRWILIGLSFLNNLVSWLLAIQLYRRYGFATVWLALSVSVILVTAVRAYYLKDPGFVWQANLLLGAVVFLLIAGIWGYSQRRLRTTLNALAVNRE